jgi:hypothetical protein
MKKTLNSFILLLVLFLFQKGFTDDKASHSVSIRMVHRNALHWRHNKRKRQNQNFSQNDLQNSFQNQLNYQLHWNIDPNPKKIVISIHKIERMTQTLSYDKDTHYAQSEQQSSLETKECFSLEIQNMTGSYSLNSSVGEKTNRQVMSCTLIDT